MIGAGGITTCLMRWIVSTTPPMRLSMRVIWKHNSVIQSTGELECTKMSVRVIEDLIDT
jgi:hypothetical protein